MRSIAEGLWVHETSKRMAGLELGGRMTVVRLPDGGLALHSPVPLADEVADRIRELGPVRAIVAPNRVHHLAVSATRALFPDARLLGAPGLEKKRKDLHFDGILGDEPAPELQGALDQHLVQGAPKLSEVVFLHRASRTLIATDLIFNFRQVSHWPTRLYLKLSKAYGRPAQTFVHRSAIADRAAMRRSVERLLAWDFDRLIVAHGDVLETGGKEALRDATSWL